MAVAYPLGLRTIIQASKRRVQPAAFRNVVPRRGAGFSQATGTEPPVVWDVAFRFTRAEAIAFRVWFEDELQLGLQEAILPIKTEFGTVDYTVRFLPDSLLLTSQIGEVWEYTASVLARSMLIPVTAPSATGLTTAWPDGLPTFLRQSKRRQRGAPFDVSDWRQGYAHFQASGSDNPVIWDVEMRFTPAQAAIFTVWFRDVLDKGVKPFTADVMTEYGSFEHILRFLPDGLLDCTEAGETFTFRARIEARRLVGTAPEPDPEAPPPPPPPGGVDPYFGNVIFLMNMTTMADQSSYAKGVSPFGNAALTTTLGFPTLLLDGAGDFVQTDAYSPTINISGDFVMEGFFYSTGTGTRDIMYVAENTSPNLMWMVYRNSSNRLALFVGSSAAGFIRITGTTVVTTNELHHWALTRTSGVMYLWLDGVLQGSWFSTSGAFVSDSTRTLAFYRVMIGSFYGSTEFWLGHIGACRVTNGVSRYTAPFTPPSFPFPTSG